ncbi:MAG TPA: PA0069 family radical SAM protein [Nitrospiraceae bacterium]|jgi:DNA repair photolyase
MRPVSNPPNPFESQHRELLEPAPRASLQMYEDATQRILSRNDSPDLQFRWSLNPYRGCFHACAYCYARRTHEYWGFGAGTDFDSKIIVKRDAPMLLRDAFEKPSWKGELIVLSGNTDCYQPLEASLGLTRACLEVCAEYRNPVAIITKAALVARDLDVLNRLNRHAWVRVYFSIPFADEAIARIVEPQAPSSQKRFETMARVASAGISTGISISPIIPGLNDEDIPDLLTRARAAGASEAMATLLRLSGSVEPVFLERMTAAFPDRIGKILHRIREVRDGDLTNGDYFARHHGNGTYWTMIERLIDVAKRKAGFPPESGESIPHTFVRPRAEQTVLF